MIFFKEISRLFLVQALFDCDQLIGHQACEGLIPRRAHQLRDRHIPNRAEARINDIDIEELLGQVFARGAHMVDRIADRPKFRRRDKLALHEATNGLLIKGEALLDLPAVFGRHSLQHVFAARWVQLFHDLGNVIAVQFGQRIGNDVGFQQRQNVFNDFVFQFDKALARDRLRRAVD